MRYTADRQGHKWQESTGQDRLLEKLYGSTAGRCLLRPLVSPVVSKIGGRFLDSRISALAVEPFIRKNGIDMRDYEKKQYVSYNDFFTRKLRPGGRTMDTDPVHFISPCDCRLSVYPIEPGLEVTVKNTPYTVGSLLRDEKLAGHFAEGYLWLFRLSVDDYHRYIYVDNGRESVRRRIPGVLHTVNPVANDIYPIYKENTREYSLMRSEHFGTLLIMEVGALMVGKIENRPVCTHVSRGQEKGNFAFGGSTIIYLTQKDKVFPDIDLLMNSVDGIETKVQIGSRIGVSASSYCERSEK